MSCRDSSVPDYDAAVVKGFGLAKDREDELRGNQRIKGDPARLVGTKRYSTFHGEKGDIFIFPGKLERPAFLSKWSEKRDLKDADVRLYRSPKGHGHEMDFVDGVYENRPICTDCEIGHRSIAACHIANICERLRLDRLDWDPAREVFTGAHAAEANRLLEVPHHNGWTL